MKCLPKQASSGHRRRGIGRVMNEQSPNWQPTWLVEVDGQNLGVGIDDHCFVVLYPQEGGGWRPGTHIPEAIARFLGSVVVPNWSNCYQEDGGVGEGQT